MVAQITVPVADVDNLISLGFDQIDIYRMSTSGAYSPITATSSASAVAPSLPASTKFRMGGRTLGFSIDGAPEQLVTFGSVVEYWTPQQVSNRINDIIPGAASYIENTVYVTSPTSGRGSSVTTTTNNAPDIGFKIGVTYLGLDQSIPLVLSTYIYNYSDASGSPGDMYKWRFSNSGLAPTSNLYGPVYGTESISPGVQVSIGTAIFVSIDGRPRKTSVIVVSGDAPKVIGSVAVGYDRPMVYESDDSGFIQIPLVRGTTVRVGMENSTYIREIVVPNTPTFDLLQAMSTSPDPFTVQTTPPYLVRRSI